EGGQHIHPRGAGEGGVGLGGAPVDEEGAAVEDLRERHPGGRGVGVFPAEVGEQVPEGALLLVDALPVHTPGGAGSCEIVDLHGLFTRLLRYDYLTLTPW